MYLGDKVAALAPIHPDRVIKTTETNSGFQYEIKDESQQTKLYTSDEVFHHKGLYNGLSVLAAAREAIGLGIASERHGANLFKNGVRPSGVLEHPSTVTEEAQKRLKKAFEENYSGLENSHRPMILEEGMKWTAGTMTNEDAQFIEQRKFQVIEICRFFGVPPHKVYDLDKATFSNIEHQALEFVQDSLMPHLISLEQSFKLQLLPRKDRSKYEIKHNVDGMLRGDFKSRQEGLQIQLQNGVISLNEYREIENRNKIIGGDEHLRASNIWGDNSNGGGK